MANLYQCRLATILNIKKEGDSSILYTCQLPNFSFNYGQFVMVSLPGAGECPISICSSANLENSFELCIKKVGHVTSEIHKLKVNDKIGIRGPYGNGFPFHLGQERNILLIGGGIGIEPLRGMILDSWFLPKYKVVAMYGTRDDKTVMFKTEFNSWRKRTDFYLAMQIKPKTKSLKKYCSVIGMVTDIINERTLLPSSVAFLCGPPIMYRFVIAKLNEHGIKDEDIYVSLERTMHCGLGLCEHCAVGTKYVCKDGPVFKYSDIKDELKRFG